MNVEKTIEFIRDNQAKAEERFTKSERSLDRIERILAQRAGAEGS
jgi:hypothetical protein